MALGEGMSKGILIKGIIKELGSMRNVCYDLYCDNK